MRKMAALFTALMVMFTALAAFPINGHASADNSPPELISCTPVKNTYVSGENVEFDLKVSDASGIYANGISIELVNTENMALRVGLWYKTDLTTPEDKARGIYTLRLRTAVNDYFKTGSYKIYSIWLEDVSGFRQGLYEGEFPQHEIQVTNTIRSDFEGPKITALSIDKTSVTAGQSVMFTVNATDPAELDYGYIVLTDPNGDFLYKTVNLTQAGSDNSRWQGSFSTDAYTLQGYYSVYTIELWDKLGNVSSSDGVKAGADKVKFYVSNPGYRPGKPVVESINFSSASAKAGDQITVTAEIDSKGMVIDCFQLYLQPLDCIDLELDSESGLYTCTWTVPANYQACTLDLRVDLWANTGAVTQYFGSCNGYTFPKLRITSVYAGLDDLSVPVGSGSFDPLDGVTAANETQGDMSGSITVEGSVDTSRTGLYLLRYKIPSMQKIWVNDEEITLNYIESRWVGVTDIMPDPNASDAPLSIAKQQLRIGAASSEVSVKRNGQSVSYATSYTTPGVYTVTDNRNGSNSVSAVICSSLPDAPAISLASTSYTGIRASWSAVAGASGYEVWYGTQKYGVYSLKHTSTSKSAGSWTKTGLTTDKAYYYKVRAYSLVGGAKIYGSFSGIHSTAPGRAALALTRASSVSAKLTWVPVSGSSGYEVWRSTQKYGTYALKYTAGSSASGWKNNSLTTGKAYYYKVRSYKVVNGAKVYGQFSAIQSIVP